MPGLIVVSDIDDTLLSKGVHPITKNIEKLRALGLPIYIVTGRAESQRARTQQSLLAAGVKYKGLLMSPGDGTDKAMNDQSKVNHVRQLAKAFTIDVAVDNDAAILKQYASAGVQHPVLASAPSYADPNNAAEGEPTNGQAAVPQARI